MTNKELQKRLKEYPDDMPISIMDYCTEDVKDVETVNVDTVYDSKGSPLGRHVIIYVIDRIR